MVLAVLLLLAVFSVFSGFQVVWTSLVHQDWKLEESGRPWACLNGSRSLGLRHVLAGHPCSRRVGLAHDGSWIDVVEVREQLGGQETLCVEVCMLYGAGGTTQSPIGGWCVLFPWVE